jgi:hypothetical protein
MRLAWEHADCMSMGPKKPKLTPGMRVLGAASLGFGLRPASWVERTHKPLDKESDWLPEVLLVA